MSKHTHTPGPWQWNHGRLLHNVPGEYSDTILDIQDKVWRPTDDDAKLIAAAPELLEACQAFSRMYGRLWDVVEPSGSGFLSPESVKEYDAIHELMTTAIAKATA
ncbi:hypothetical protein SOK29_25370 [Pseudomonas aeruginosa]|uniref:hypothetical protein n=1 Tax=Pseudomonas aeruginosa TaxID=287 RepID=UPI002A6AFA3A|nr:hypothetical protein [Pseudomonas aeruginosa]MDY1510686.1 hypothetical protein [Pseudomonas aeruginosa]